MRVIAAPGSSPIFDLKGGRINLDGRPILPDISFVLNPGEFVALMGDNGAGKTTLVKALLGLAPLSAGELKVFGTPVAGFRQWWRVGYVPQRWGTASPVPASVQEVVLSGLAARSRLSPKYGSAEIARAGQALSDVNMAGHAGDAIAALSGGQQQRVLIARALIGEPEVLILDEPAASIDADAQAALTEILSRAVQRGVSVLLVAHSLGPMESLVRRSVAMSEGTIVYDGPPLEAGDPQLHIHHHPEQTSSDGYLPLHHRGLG